MDWHIEGSYLATCTCEVQEHWRIDGTITSTPGGCKGVIVFQVKGGSFTSTNLSPDLAGVDFAIVNLFPDKVTDDDFWEMGIIVDSVATDDQARAVEQIVSGRVGGPFSDLRGMIGEFLGMERARIKIEMSAKPSVRIQGGSNYVFSPNRDAAGTLYRGGGALFPFGTDRIGGRADGPPARMFGSTITPRFAEYASFELDNHSSSMDEYLKGLRGYN